MTRRLSKLTGEHDAKGLGAKHVDLDKRQDGRVDGQCQVHVQLWRHDARDNHDTVKQQVKLVAALLEPALENIATDKKGGAVRSRSAFGPRIGEEELQRQKVRTWRRAQKRAA